MIQWCKIERDDVQRGLIILVHGTLKASMQIQSAFSKSDGSLAFIIRGFVHSSKDVLLQFTETWPEYTWSIVNNFGLHIEQYSTVQANRSSMLCRALS